MTTIKGISKIKSLGLKIQHPTMNIDKLTAENELNRRQREAAKVGYFLNSTELNAVKSLFQIRNAHFYKKYIKPVQLADYSSDVYPSERVFIAGKIFPVLNIMFGYRNVSDIEMILNPMKIEIIDGASKIKYYEGNIHNSKYISVDGKKMVILLPKNYGGIDFPKLMYNFLTNDKSVTKYIGGEFPDYETYCLALRDKAINLKEWKGQDGSWLTKHRTNDGNKIIWKNAIHAILKYKLTGRLAPFSQIYDFYDAVDYYITKVYKHEVRWCKGAKKLVKALSKSPVYMGGMEGGSVIIDNDVETILNELNLGICDFAIGKFHELLFGKYSKTPLKGEDAYNWDVNFVTYEQQIIAPPIYKKTSANTISKYQDMADKDPKSIMGTLSQGSSWLKDILPGFDDFTPNAKVTDGLFRTDLPLLMMYLDKHKIHKNKVSTSLKNYLILNNNPDGKCFVNNICKEIIKDYAIK